MTTRDEREREDARRLASFDEQTDGADEIGTGRADPEPALFVADLVRTLKYTFGPETPLGEFLRRRISEERSSQAPASVLMQVWMTDGII